MQIDAIRHAFARLACETPDVSLLGDPGVWEQIKRSAGPHGMGPVLAHHLRPHLPAGERAWADQLLLRAWRSHEVMLRHLNSVLEILDRAQVRAMVLKGPVLGVRYYQPAFLRKFSSDLDLGVAAADLATACSALEAAGYTVQGSIAEELARNHHIGLKHASLPTLELHFRLSHRPLGPRIEPLLDRAQTFPLPGGRTVWVPDPADELFHLMLHRASGVATFFHLWEIHHLWVKAPAELRERTLATAAREHLSGVVALTDLALRKYWGEGLLAEPSLPAAAYEEFEELWEPGVEVSRSVRLRRRWLEVRLADRPADALRVLFATGRIAVNRFRPSRANSQDDTR